MIHICKLGPGKPFHTTKRKRCLCSYQTVHLLYMAKNSQEVKFLILIIRGFLEICEKVQTGRSNFLDFYGQFTIQTIHLLYMTENG